MPYYVEKNDTMFDDFEDTLKANSLFYCYELHYLFM